MALRRLPAIVIAGLSLAVGAVGATGCGSSPASASSPTAGTSSTSPAPSITVGSVPALGGPAFCQDISSTVTKLSQLDLSSTTGASASASGATGPLRAEQQAFAGLAAKAPASIEQPLSDLASTVGTYGADLAMLATSASDPSAGQQVLSQLSALQGHLTADEGALAQWVGTHCSVTTP